MFPRKRVGNTVRGTERFLQKELEWSVQLLLVEGLCSVDNKPAKSKEAEQMFSQWYKQHPLIKSRSRKGLTEEVMYIACFQKLGRFLPGGEWGQERSLHAEGTARSKARGRTSAWLPGGFREQE